MNRWMTRTGLMAWLLGMLLADAACGDRVLVVCPGSLQPAMREWVDYRRRTGHEVTLVDRLRNRPDQGEAFDTLLIVGDGDQAGLPPGYAQAEVIRRYGPERLIATDLGWRDAAGADVVARLPFVEANQLAAYLNRVLERERRGDTKHDNRIQITTGVGGFSPLIDGAIEAAGRRIVDGLAPLTADVSLVPIGGSSRFGETASDERGGVWVWLGHGQRHALPGIAADRLVEQCGGADVAVLLACYAGDFAAHGRCVAEQLLHDADGPLAVIASTRVSMPYGNARLGGALLAALTRSRNQSLGPMWSDALTGCAGPARSELLAKLDPLASLLGGDASQLEPERLEHARMYCLLGDPLLVPDRTGELPVRLASSDTDETGIKLQVEAPCPGRLSVSLARRGKEKAARGDRPVNVMDIERAGSLVVTVPTGDWRAGERVVRARLTAEEKQLIGAVIVQRAKERPREKRLAKAIPERSLR